MVVSPDGNIVTIAQVLPESSGSYTTTLKAGGTMSNSGEYEIRSQYGAQKITTTFLYSWWHCSSCNTRTSATPEPVATPEPTPEPVATPEPTPEPVATPEPLVEQVVNCGPGTESVNGCQSN